MSNIVKENGVKIVAGTVFTFGLMFYGFMKNKLPPIIARPFGRLIFYPLLLGTQLKYYLKDELLYFTPITERVLLGCAPVTPQQVQQLKSMNVVACVNLLDEWAGPSDPTITVLHCPTVDHAEPTVETYRRAVQFILDQLGNKRSNATGPLSDASSMLVSVATKTEPARQAFEIFSAAERSLFGPTANDNCAKVCIFCKGGHGRSAAVAFAYLYRILLALELKNRTKQPLMSDQVSPAPLLVQIQKGLLALRPVRKTLAKQKNLSQFIGTIHHQLHQR